MPPDDFCTRWERDYRNSCGIRPGKPRNDLSLKEREFQTREFLVKGRTGFLLKGFFVLSAGEKHSGCKYEIFF